MKPLFFVLVLTCTIRPPPSIFSSVHHPLAVKLFRNGSALANRWPYGLPPLTALSPPQFSRLSFQWHIAHAHHFRAGFSRFNKRQGTNKILVPLLTRSGHNMTHPLFYGNIVPKTSCSLKLGIDLKLGQQSS